MLRTDTESFPTMHITYCLEGVLRNIKKYQNKITNFGENVVQNNKFTQQQQQDIYIFFIVNAKASQWWACYPWGLPRLYHLV